MPSYMRPGITVEFHREEIRVDTAMGELVADPRWRTVDTQGHEHRFVGQELPTLEWVVTGTEWIGDEYDSSEIEVGEYRCRECGEVVEPHWNRDFSPRFVPGLVDAKIVTDDAAGMTGTWLCRAEEIEALTGAEDREAKAWEIVASREPDMREWRGSR